MAKAIIGNRPADITKEDDGIKVVFHPLMKGAKHPDAAVFSIKLTAKDLDVLKAAL